MKVEKNKSPLTKAQTSSAEVRSIDKKSRAQIIADRQMRRAIAVTAEVVFGILSGPTGCAAQPQSSPTIRLLPSPAPTPLQHQYPIKPFDDEEGIDDTPSKVTKGSTSSVSPNATKPFNLIELTKWELILDGRESGDLFSKAYFDAVPLEAHGGLNLYLYETTTPSTVDPKSPLEEDSADDYLVFKVGIERVAKNVSEPKGQILANKKTDDIVSRLKISSDGMLFAVMLEKDGNLFKATVTEYKKTQVTDTENYKIIKDKSEIDWDADQTKILMFEKEQPNTSNTKMLFFARNRQSGDVFSGIKDPKTGKINVLYKYSREK